MPATYTIFPELSLKYVTIAPSVELSELLELARQYFDDPEYHPQNRFLVDATALQRSSGGFVEAYQLHSFYKRMIGPVPKPLDIAIVAPGDFAYGLSHMFLVLSHLSNFMKVKIFDNLDGALEWLAVPPLALCSCAQSESCLIHSSVSPCFVPD